MFSNESFQLDFHSELLENLVPKDHAYRKLLKLVDFESLAKGIKSIYSSNSGKKAYPVESALKMLVLQQAENHSDREMERFLKENVCAKYFCGFRLTEHTPDHTYFCKLRKKVGAERISKIFNQIVESLRKQNIISDTFTFIDATAVVSKSNIWEARDKAIEDKQKTLNNSNIEKYSADPYAKIGCKDGSKFWYGYKRTQAVDMKHGMITGIDVSPANLTDAQLGVKVLSPLGMIFADKGYDTADFLQALSDKGLHSGVIKKNNRKDKNKDLDLWLTKRRSPFEGLFHYADQSVRYFRGLTKVTFHQTLDAISQNLKTLVNIYDHLSFLGIRVS